MRQSRTLGSVGGGAQQCPRLPGQVGRLCVVVEPQSDVLEQVSLAMTMQSASRSNSQEAIF